MVEQSAGTSPDCRAGSVGGFMQQDLELGENLLRLRWETVGGREKEKLGAGVTSRPTLAQRPWVRIMLVLALVSSMKARRVGPRPRGSVIETSRFRSKWKRPRSPTLIQPHSRSPEPQRLLHKLVTLTPKGRSRSPAGPGAARAWPRLDRERTSTIAMRVVV